MWCKQQQNMHSMRSTKLQLLLSHQTTDAYLCIFQVYFRSHEKIISEILQTMIDDDHIKGDIDMKRKQQRIVSST